jgi:hypothetical protein
LYDEQIGLAFAAFLFWTVSKIEVGPGASGETEALDQMSRASGEELATIFVTIQEGAAAFLWYAISSLTFCMLCLILTLEQLLRVLFF